MLYTLLKNCIEIKELFAELSENMEKETLYAHKEQGVPLFIEKIFFQNYSNRRFMSDQVVALFFKLN